MLINWLLATPRLRFFNSLLRRFFPIFRIGKTVVVSRYNLALEVLQRDKDFTISQINGPSMKGINLDFFLGMDQGDSNYFEKNLMLKVVYKSDHALIESLLSNVIQKNLNDFRPGGEIEIVSHYTRKVPMLLINQYFGIQLDEKQQMGNWLKILFHFLFLSFKPEGELRTQASLAADGLRAHILSQINLRKTAISSGDLPKETLLDRLILFQQNESLVTDDLIVRNLSGLLIGALETTSKCVVYCLQEIFSRPDVLQMALVYSSILDIEKLRGICMEALRFNPHNPVLLRFSEKAQKIGPSSEISIPPGSKIFVNIFSAMHDNQGYESPNLFRSDRKEPYLHFGWGQHICFGRHINAVQIPLMVMYLLRLPNVQLARKNGGLKMGGPFPNEYFLKYQ